MEFEIDLLYVIEDHLWSQQKKNRVAELLTSLSSSSSSAAREVALRTFPGRGKQSDPLQDFLLNDA